MKKSSPNDVLPFTLEDGLNVQLKQLNRWKRVLNDTTFRQLHNKCKEENQMLMEQTEKPNGYDVWRGTNMDQFISNIAYDIPEEDEL